LPFPKTLEWVLSFLQICLRSFLVDICHCVYMYVHVYECLHWVTQSFILCLAYIFCHDQDLLVLTSVCSLRLLTDSCSVEVPISCTKHIHIETLVDNSSLINCRRWNMITSIKRKDFEGKRRRSVYPNLTF